MSFSLDLFKATTVAGKAFYGDFKFKAYYDSGFQLEAMTTFMCHIARTLYNIAATLLRFAILSLSVFNPFAWIGLPGQAINLADDVIAVGVSAFTAIVFPLLFVLRTLSTLIFGYEVNTKYDCGNEVDEADVELAMKIC